jgi:miniconductance mechanosensitive channel
MFESAQEWLIAQGLSASLATPLLRLGLGILVVVASWIAGVIAGRIIRRVVAKVVETSKTDWDDVVMQHGVFDHLLRMVPALVLQLLVAIPLHGLPGAIEWVRTAIHIYMLVVLVLVIDSALNAAFAIYRQYPVSKRFNLKPFIQVLLIFKDSILGFVAGIQLSGNRMVQRGDWIAMPKYGADGDVLEIALTTVKVQNWDKTITTIPTYALISDAFKNWRGMEESGGRRIKRSISIDMTTVRICDPGMIDRFRRIAYISDYIDEKLKETKEWNSEHGMEDDVAINGRNLTNIGTFRQYVAAYLRHHPQVHKDMTFLVRQLQPTEKGLPIEIYVFSRDQRWVQYEGIQSDIFDHIIAVVPEFDLKVFQQPTGQDVVSLLDRIPAE